MRRRRRRKRERERERERRGREKRQRGSAKERCKGGAVINTGSVSEHFEVVSGLKMATLIL